MVLISETNITAATKINTILPINNIKGTSADGSSSFLGMGLYRYLKPNAMAALNINVLSVKGKN